MASDLAQLTDSYLPDNPIGSGLPVERLNVYRGEAPALSEFNTGVGTKLDDILNKLTGANGQERYQLWPEKVVRSGLTAAGDALVGNVPQWAVDKDTGEVHTSPQMIEKAQEISALAGTGGLAGGAEGTALNVTPSLRPALKYKDKIYKGQPGQQHLDVIPKDLYPEFEKMAMSGEDLTHYNFGFMNHKGQFLDREKALEYAINEGLVDAHAGQYGALTSTLMADSSKPGTAIEAMKDNPFYSAVERNVKAIPQDKMTGEQWLGTLNNKPGVKPEELQWTGLKDFLEENKGKPITKEQVQEHLANNKVELKEVNKIHDPLFENLEGEDALPNATRYHGYQLPGGENYREKLLTLPDKKKLSFEDFKNEHKQFYPDATLETQQKRYNQYLSGTGGGIGPSKDVYKSSHWDEPNILAHVRMNDRIIDGKKSLHLEEIQSDWHQQGRDRGYSKEPIPKATGWENTGPIGSGNKVPDAPFKKSWHELALKRMIREAAEKGYDRLSWTPGEAQATRYDLSKQIDKLAYDPKTGHLQGFKDGGMAMDNKVPKDKLADFVGKEAAEKLLNKPTKVLGNGYHTLENADLKIGGEGMKGFYDQIIPKTLEKLGKEHGVKVKQGALPNDLVRKTVDDRYTVVGDKRTFDTKAEAEAAAKKDIVHYIDLPQSLKDQAMRGFPLFSSGVPIDLLDNKK